MVKKKRCRKVNVDFLELRAAIAGYLRYQRQCPLICFDRIIGYATDEGIPDLLAVTDRRLLIEVEIKMSFSDFRADAKKLKWQYREGGKFPSRWATPRMFYYAAPPALAAKILPHLKATEFGLITTGGLSQPGGMPGIKVLRGMKPKKDRPRVSLRLLIKMADNQSGTLCRLAAKVAQFERGRK